MPVKPLRPRLPSLNALRAFEAAARCGSFVRAADELGVTPGAVTQQIRQLEAWLGFPLFRRLAQGVAPTEAALEALPRLTRGFDTLAQAVQGLRDSQSFAMPGGRALTIAALPCIAQLWLSPRLAALQRALPNLHVSISAMEQPPDPRREPHDLSIFYREPGTVPGGMTVPDADAILPVCTPVLAKVITSLPDLAGQTLLHDAVWRSDWARWLAFAGGPAAVDAARGPSFSLYSLALDAALSGSGVLMGRTSLVGPLLSEGRLVAPFPQALPLSERLTIIPSAADRPHPQQAEIAAWLRAAA
jgi:LysR family glycine cleavage system transcriptional activator